MKALLTTKRSTGIASIVGAIGYLIFDKLISSDNNELLEFFRGFFTGITLTSLVIFTILVITEMIKKNKAKT